MNMDGRCDQQQINWVFLLFAYLPRLRAPMSPPGSKIIDSPCVRNCCLNDDDICLGCGRSLQEITRWSTSTDAGKEAILLAAAERRQLIWLRQHNQD
ncbi:DUF1289 domain-containing protein [Cellvibrio zantedeschiae]|uniref:DUF1289 domain-containing protein n=1 Tax=Cellvibrio zantedeschiae TaxID=1237077 RepID=UPI001E590175|nr:DUF1289 domain-containing protein [Cellvibrio zantedeschiae]